MNFADTSDKFHRRTSKKFGSFHRNASGGNSKVFRNNRILGEFLLIGRKFRFFFETVTVLASLSIERKFRIFSKWRQGGNFADWMKKVKFSDMCQKNLANFSDTSEGNLIGEKLKNVSKLRF